MTPSTASLLPALQRRLEGLANQKSRHFWQRYMKGAAIFRGVPMAGVRKAVHAWWQTDGPAQLPLRSQKSLTLKLFEEPYSEDKLAGTLVFQEILMSSLVPGDLERMGSLFERGLISDWNTCDWFCVKVLGKWVSGELPSPLLTEAITEWKTSRSIWQRRAANVAFVNLAKHGDSNFRGFTHRMLDTCATTLRSSERFAQTGAAWLLRELAESNRPLVLAFARKHLELLSREAVRSITEKMPKSEQARLLKAHAALGCPTSFT